MCGEHSNCCGGHGGCSPALTGRFKKPALLTLIAEAETHGYLLIEKLEELGIEGAEPGSVYRLLRKLEKEGLVESEWETDGKGPARRSYSLTAEGFERLSAWRKPLEKTERLSRKLIESINEHEN
ncbi:MAG: PadR family transcriptional regulator [bacterium]